MIAAACHGRIREFTGNTSYFINDYRIFFGTFHKRFVAASEALENRRIPNATAVNDKRIVRESSTNSLVVKAFKVTINVAPISICRLCLGTARLWGKLSCRGFHFTPRIYPTHRYT
jgi:hypothetical protein